MENHDHPYPEEEETQCKLICTQILKFSSKIEETLYEKFEIKIFTPSKYFYINTLNHSFMNTISHISPLLTLKGIAT